MLYIYFGTMYQNSVAQIPNSRSGMVSQNIYSYLYNTLIDIAILLSQNALPIYKVYIV